MQDKLHIALLQSDIYWHQTDANLGALEEKIWSIHDAVDLVVLPEMFTTGFTMASQKMSEVMNSKTFRWMKQQAAQTKAVVTGSYIVRDGQQHFNRLIWMRPDGTFDLYDKKHLFRMAGEDERFSPGNKKLITELKGWKICPLICYDLRFPIWCKNIYDQNSGHLQYDILLFVANWPQPRIAAWNSLLRARAIENHCYSVGVNRVGKDGHDVPYNGHSAVYDPKGNEMLLMGSDEQVSIVSIESAPLLRYREKFPAYLDEEGFSIV